MSSFRYQIFNKLVVRTNSTPLDELKNFLDIENQKQFLIDFFAKESNKEKLYIASASLYNSFELLITGELDAVKERKTIYSLAKYFLRMSNRPTPFGLFSGCFSTELLEHQGQFLLDNYKSDRHTRIDMGYFMPLIARLSKIKAVKESLNYTINSSLYRLANEYRYVEYTYVNKKRSHRLTSVGCSDYLNEIVKQSVSGITYGGLMNILKKYSSDEEELVFFIDALIESQVLMHSLEPPVTDVDSMTTLTKFVGEIINRNKHEPSKDLEQLTLVYQKLCELKILLLKLDSNINTSADYENITSLLNSFGFADELYNTLQIDTIGSVQNVNVTSEYDVNFSNMSEALRALIAFNSYTNTTLEDFKRRFVERYERQEVSLLEVLDEEAGIGYPINNVNDSSALLVGIPIQEKHGVQQVTLNRRNYILFEKIQNALVSGLAEIYVTDDDVEKLIRDLPQDFVEPQSIALIYRFFFDGTKSCPVILYCGGSSTTNLISRFCYGDEQMMLLGHELTKKEMAMTDKDCVLAEVVHLPQDRIGNVLIRPSFYNYEIPFLGASSKECKGQIRPDDLMISVVNDRIILRSKKLNKRVVPRISCAHNFQSGLPFYRLLGDLQAEGSNVNMNFGWDSLGRLYKYLPRVKYKDVILKSARWTLDENDYKILIQNRIDSQSLISEVKKWRDEWKIPQYVVIADSDNELFIDFNNYLCNRVFINNIERRPFVTLVEVSQNYMKSPVIDKNGNTYAAQFLVSFFSDSNRPSSIVKQRFANSKIPRKFILGDEWIYFKVYLGVRFSDHFLSIVLPKILKSLKKNGIVHKWFYIRYGDPAYHLRIRFRLSNKSDISQLIFLFNEHLKKKINSGMVEKIQVDTYVRELERYGNRSIEISENLFDVESSIIIKLLSVFKAENNENIVWLSTLKMIDIFLVSCKLELADRYKILHGVATTFGKEFGKESNIFLRKSLAGKYRYYKKDMYDMLKGNHTSSFKITKILETYTKEIAVYCSEIVAKHQRNELEIELNELLSSHIHLLVNRMFRTNARMHEMILYDFLSNYYLSELKRSNPKQKEQQYDV